MKLSVNGGIAPILEVMVGFSSLLAKGVKWSPSWKLICTLEPKGKHSWRFYCFWTSRLPSTWELWLPWRTACWVELSSVLSSAVERGLPKSAVQLIPSIARQSYSCKRGELSIPLCYHCKVYSCSFAIPCSSFIVALWYLICLSVVTRKISCAYFDRSIVIQLRYCSIAFLYYFQSRLHTF